MAVLDFEGLSALELQNSLTGLDEFAMYRQLFTRGGFPELWIDMERPVGLFLDSYIATHLERDVKQVLAVGNLRDFERFLRACALRSGQQLNKSVLARDVGISVPTASEWLSVLEALGQIHLLEPWFGNLNKRLVKAPKLYLAEPALMVHLCGYNADTILQSPLIGALWETFVFAEMRKQLAFRGQSTRLWYYRDQSQYEADFVWERGHELTLFECKWTSEPVRSMVSNLDKIESIFAEKAKHHRIREKKLVSRTNTYERREGFTSCSILKGLIDS